MGAISFWHWAIILIPVVIVVLVVRAATRKR